MKMYKTVMPFSAQPYAPVSSDEVKTYKAIIDGEVVFKTVRIAEDFFSRMVGLLGTSKLDGDEGLLIRPCRQVHTYYMRFNIDALFLSESGEIIHIESRMNPGRISRFIKESCQVLEIAGGTAELKGIQVGQRVQFGAADSSEI